MEQAIRNQDLNLVTKFSNEGERYPLMLHNTVFTADLEMVRVLFKLQGNVNTDIDMGNLFIDHGADISIKDHNGVSPWDWVVRSNNYEFVKKIISRSVPLIEAEIIYSTCLADLDSLDIINLFVQYDEGSIVHRGIINSNLDMVEWV